HLGHSDSQKMSAVFMFRSQPGRYIFTLNDTLRCAPSRKELEMKKTLFRIAALAVALAFPAGVFAQTTAPTKAPSESKETKMESKSTESGGKKTTTKKKSTSKKKSKKGKTTESKSTQEKKTEEKKQ